MARVCFFDVSCVKAANKQVELTSFTSSTSAMAVANGVVLRGWASWCMRRLNAATKWILWIRRGGDETTGCIWTTTLCLRCADGEFGVSPLFGWVGASSLFAGAIVMFYTIAGLLNSEW
jgi:hypothetical protein